MQQQFYSLAGLLGLIVIVAVALFGGMVGVAVGLQSAVSELSPDNRWFGAVAGIIIGLPSAALVYRLSRSTISSLAIAFGIAAGISFASAALLLSLWVAMMSAI